VRQVLVEILKLYGILRERFENREYVSLDSAASHQKRGVVGIVIRSIAKATQELVKKERVSLTSLVFQVDIICSASSSVAVFAAIADADRF
jgi:hypothetical protein